MSQLISAAGMATLAMASVGLWTLRVALTARGCKSVAAAVAAVEAIVFAVAFANVAAHLDSPPRVAGYGAGVALGTVIGLTIDSRLAAGTSEVDVVVPGRDTVTAEHLRRLGWPATTFAGDGPSGPVTLICIAIDDRHVSELTNAVHQAAPNAFWTVQRLSASRLPHFHLPVPSSCPG